jgi:hypothetical protein
MGRVNGKAALQYDLYLASGPRRLVLRIRNHGIRLGPDSLGWEFDGSARWQKLSDIGEIHLTRGGAIARAALADPAEIAEARLENRSPELLGESENKWRWTMRVESPRERAEVFFDRQGRLSGADLSGTLRVVNRNLLDGGQDFADVMRAVRARLGGDPVIAYLRVTRKQVEIRTEDKRYEAGPDGVVDRTPPFFIQHVINDLTTGRFSLDAIDWSRLSSLQAQARAAVKAPYKLVEGVGVSVPQGDQASGQAGPLQWAVDICTLGSLTRVTFDHDGHLLDAHAPSDRHYCE